MDPEIKAIAAELYGINHELNALGETLAHCILSDEELDTAGNKAGVTDGLFEIARAIRELAGAIKDARS
jgi:hypothetical protein